MPVRKRRTTAKARECKRIWSTREYVNPLFFSVINLPNVLSSIEGRLLLFCPTPAHTTVGGKIAANHCRKGDRKSTRLNSSHRCISYAVFCLKKKNLDIRKRFHNLRVARLACMKASCTAGSPACKSF